MVRYVLVRSQFVRFDVNFGTVFLRCVQIIFGSQCMWLSGCRFGISYSINQPYDLFVYCLSIVFLFQGQNCGSAWAMFWSYLTSYDFFF